MKKNIVVISGGNGSGVSINACKAFLSNIQLSAVIPMSDSGGSTGVLRREFNTLPVGDIMRAVVAMSKHDSQLLKQIFYKTRFGGEGKLKDHNLGNLFLVLVEQYGGDFMSSLRAFHEAVDAVGIVHPVTLDISDLAVEFVSGRQQVGEHEIDRPLNRNDRIVRAWLEPQPSLYDGARQALEHADIIMFGPGSLYCSIIPSLLVDGMQNVLKVSQAKFVYVVGNAYEHHGEAGPTSLPGFISGLESYLPRPLDAIVFNNHILTKSEEQAYMKKQWDLIAYDEDDLKAPVVAGDFERSGGGLDSKKLGSILQKIIF